MIANWLALSSSSFLTRIILLLMAGGIVVRFLAFAGTYFSAVFGVFYLLDIKLLMLTSLMLLFIGELPYGLYFGY